MKKIILLLSVISLLIVNSYAQQLEKRHNPPPWNCGHGHTIPEPSSLILMALGVGYILFTFSYRSKK